MIYFIQMNDDGPIKIGVADDPLKRLAGLQCGNPFPLKLLGVIPGSFKKEREIHNLLEDTRIRGEWFEPSHQIDELLKAAKSVHTPIKEIPKKVLNKMLDFRSRGRSHKYIGVKTGMTWQQVTRVFANYDKAREEAL